MTDIEREDMRGVQQEAMEQASEQREERHDPTEQDWQAALTEALKQRDDYLLMAQRTQAEFMNYKKRTESVRTESFDEGVREALLGMLPTIDNFERAIDAARKSGEDGALLQGVEMTQRVMLEAAQKLGLEEVPAEGQRFDPELHNAVMRVDEGEPGMVLEVFQKGYSVRGKIIRYPMVKVAAE